MKLIADDSIPFLKGIPERFAEVVYLPTRAFVHEQVKDADVLIVRSPNKCDRALLEGSRVKFIASATIGYDHIDIDYCRENGIKWVNSPGCNASSVAQYILSGLIELSHKEGFSLHDKTYGIVGVGNVGRQVERVYQAYGLSYLKCDPPRAEQEGSEGFVSLREIAESCDIISFHVPLERKGAHPTYHLADEDFFRSLKKKPYYINVARGSVHDTPALLRAKQEGLIRGMIIDCWENEPEISLELLAKASIATPHIAGFSADGKANGTRMCLEAIVKEYGIDLPDLSALVQAPPPGTATIDLNRFSGNRVEAAILSTYTPLSVERLLRDDPSRFEYYRKHYDNPREYPAYTVVNACPEERVLLEKLGFGY